MAGQKVSWTVTGIRNDAYVRKYGAPVEQDKLAQHRGKYLMPDLYGQPEELGVHYFPDLPQGIPAIGADR